MSVGQVLGGAVGAVVGFFTPVGPMYGAQIGMMIGGVLDPPKGPDLTGPRLSDLSQQSSSYGLVIPRAYGTVALYGNIFWIENNAIKEVAKKTKSGGGKGGGSKGTTTTYSYYATMALGLCEGPISGIRRIWCGADLIYDAGTTDQGAMRESNRLAPGFHVYLGDDTQTPDTRMQAALGVANTPAYRGIAYIVFYDFALAKYGNSLLGAQFKVEVVSLGSIAKYSIVAGNMPIPVQDDQRIWTAIGWNGRMFVAGRLPWTNYSSDVIATSPDGLTWTLGSVPSAPTNEGISHVVGNSELWIAIQRGWSNYVWGSKDAITWYPITVGMGAIYMTVCYDGDMWMIFPMEQATYAVTSSDGAYWLPSGVFATAGGFGQNSLAGDGTVFIAVRASDCIVYTKKTNSWSAPITLTGNTNGSSICYAKELGCFLVIGGMKASFSYDRGQTWTTYTTIALGNTGPLIWTGEVFYAGPNMSYDGINWVGRITLYPNYQNLSIYASAWNGAVICQVGSDADRYNNLFTITPTLITQTLPTLATIVQTELLKTNMLAVGDMNTSLLSTQCRGFIVGRVTSIRSALEPLQAAWPFDVIQAGYKIKFVPRGGGSIATVAKEDLAAVAYGDSAVSITMSREMDTILPKRVRLLYLDAEREYNTGEQYTERQNTLGVNIVTVELAIVMNSTEAIRTCEILLYMYWLERYDVSFKLPGAFNNVEAADVITINAEEGTYALRVTAATYTQDNRIECRAKYSAAATYVSNAQGAVPLSTGMTMTEKGYTFYEVLDIPETFETIDTIGTAIAMTGYSTTWPGGTLYRSDDLGTSWTPMVSFTKPGCVCGFASLVGSGRTDIFDAINAITCTLLPGGTIASVSEASLFAGENHFAFGLHGRWEIIGVKTVTQLASDSFLLTDLLRGRFGTEWAMPLHLAGDELILLDINNMQYLNLSTSSIGQEKWYRGITNGYEFDSDGDYKQIFTAVSLKPLAPVYFNGSKDPVTGDMTISWVRRTRIGGEWRDSVDAALSETAESYDVEIYADGNYAAVKRSVTVASASFVYTAAMQTADFGGSQITLCAKVYQVSSKVGRGYEKQGWLPVALPTPPFPSLVCLTMSDAALSEMYGHTVTKYGAVARSLVQTKWGDGASYHANATSSQDYIRVTNATPLGMTPLIECECWVYFTDLSPGNSYIFTHSADSGGWGFSVYANGVNICLRTANYVWINAAAGLVINQWFYVKLVVSNPSYGQAAFLLYVNGVYKGSQYGLGFNGNNAPYDFVLGSYNFRGYIEDFRVTLNHSRDALPSGEFFA